MKNKARGNEAEMANIARGKAECRYISIEAVKNKARGNEAEMANIARGKAECYISIEAECRVLYFSYSTSKAML